MQIELYAWCTMMPEGELSLVGMLDSHGVHMPLISFDRKRIADYEAIAREHGRLMRQPVYLVRLASADILTIIDPGTAPRAPS